jgi:hypothetical protein
MTLNSAVLVALARSPSPIVVTFGSGEWAWARISLQFEDIITTHFQKAVEVRSVKNSDDIQYSWSWAASTSAGFVIAIHYKTRSRSRGEWSEDTLAGRMFMPSKGNILRGSNFKSCSDKVIGDFFTIEGER